MLDEKYIEGRTFILDVMILLIILSWAMYVLGVY